MLTFLALQGAPYIYDISRLRVNIGKFIFIEIGKIAHMRVIK
jgi:hypothetical protein